MSNYPSEGIVESPPSMADAMIAGERNRMVRTRNQSDIAPGDYLLLSRGKALGVIRVGDREIADEDGLEEMAAATHITKSMREEWAAVMPSWVWPPPWYVWPVEVIERFDRPRSVAGASITDAVSKGITLMGDGGAITIDSGEDIEKAIWSTPASKNRLASRLVAMLPPHKTYVEPFAGSAAVFFEKEPAEVEVLNDLNPDYVHAFRTIQKLTGPQLKWLGSQSWVGDQSTYRRLHKSQPDSDLPRLYRFLYLTHCSFDKRMGTTFNYGAQGQHLKTFQKVEAAVERLKGAKIYNGHYADVVRKYDSKNTAYFLDPPYAGFDAGVGEKKFNEQEFADLLKKLEGKFCITYGTRGEFPGMAKRAGYRIGRIRMLNTYNPNGRAQARAGWIQLVITNYTPVTKQFLPDFVIEDYDPDEIEKIRDVDNYDPAKLSDEVLRDDFRICLAWYASWEKDPEGFTHSLDTIHALLKQILAETKSRGPDTITFDPEGMKPSVRSFFLKVAKEVSLPEEMFKRVALTRDMDSDALNKSELIVAHWDLHGLYDEISNGPVKGWSTEDVVNLHAKVVDKLYSIGVQQPPPPDNGLDELSADFEDHADDQRVDYYEEPATKIEKRDTMQINRSGTQLGDVIKVGDVLSYFKDFRLRMPYIYLVGGLANKGETEGDIDILVNESDEDIAPWLRDVIEFRLGRALPPALSKRLQIHFDRSRGPFTDHIELYNLRCERVNPEGRIKEMRDGEAELEGGDFASAKHTYREFRASFDNLNDEKKILDALRAAATGPLKSEVIDECSEKFDPQGVTALLLLTTSHIAIHTWPEEGAALLDILTCSSDPDIKGAVDLVVRSLKGWDSVEKRIPLAEDRTRLLYENGIFVNKAIFGSPMGKTYLAARLIRLFPEHKTYVEPFIGGGQVFFRKEPSDQEVISDLDKEIAFAYQYMKTMSDADCDKLEKKNWVGSRSVFDGLKKQTNLEGLDRLHRFLYLKRHSFSCNFDTYSVSRDGQKAASADKVRRYKGRLDNVRVHNLDYEKVIEKYDSEDTFFFLDPPYAGYDTIRPNDSVLSQRGWDEDRFAKTIRSIKGKFLCTYGIRSRKDLFDGFETSRMVHYTQDAGHGGLRKKTQTLIVKNYNERGKRIAVTKAAEASFKLGKCFPMPKPTRPSYPGQPQTVDSLIELFEKHDDWLPAYIEKKYYGVNHQIHKDGDTVTIYSEDGGDNTDRFPGIIEAVKKLRAKSLILCAEIEQWDGSQHLPREAVTGYINAKSDPDDSNLCANVYDVLLVDGRDIHGEPTEARLKALSGLGIGQSTVGVPKAGERLNAPPAATVADLGQLRRDVEKYRRLPGSAGVVLKRKGAPYPLAGTTSDTWVKFHNETLLYGLVSGREKTAAGAWVYQYGIMPGKEKPEETVEVAGKKIVPVGDSFVSTQDLYNGDPISIATETVNLTRTKKGITISAWVPRVMDDEPAKVDTVDTLAARACKDLVLQEKDVSESGETDYRVPSRVRKQEDPYLEVPPEGKTYRFVVQHHHRGRSVHSDVRIENGSKMLIGWTLNTQIPGAIKEPVTTLAQAKEYTTNEAMGKISKINWVTGEWANRPKRGADKLVRTEILSERKALEPHAWIDVEGKTKDPEPGKPPPVGGTRQYPGVFAIVEQGTVEYGAQKPWFHEYFFHGDALNYRMFFRELSIRKADDKHCEICGEGPAIELAWEDSPGGLFCEKCSGWLTKAGIVLPPSEEQPMGDKAAWLAIYPEDSTPYVLGPEAVKKGWMPDDGDSALPKFVARQISEKYRYWSARGARAKAIRDDLVESIKAGDTTLNYEYSKREKASPLNAKFVLQEQTWRGPIQVRVGPSRTRWMVRLDVGRPELVVIELSNNPIDDKEISASVESDKHKASMDLSGRISPGHYLNPTKATPSFIEVLDRGPAKVLAMSDDLIKVNFFGSDLKGLYIVERNADEWLWTPSQEAPQTEKRDELFEVYFPFEYVRVEKAQGAERRLVTGIVLEPGVVDAQNDIEKAEVIERAAHQFLANYNRPPTDGGTTLGLMHKQFQDVGVELVESSIAPADYYLGGTTNAKKVKKGSWVVTVHVSSDKTWSDVKDGRLTGFSVGGTVITADNHGPRGATGER